MQKYLCKALEEALGKLWRRAPDSEQVVPIFLSPDRPYLLLHTHGLVSPPNCAACEQSQHLLTRELHKYATLELTHYHMDYLLDPPSSLPAANSDSDSETRDYSCYTALIMRTGGQNPSVC
jgi:hypothetical protein